MLILFWVVMILFSIIETKIVHYSSLAYFPLTFLSAYTLYNFKSHWSKWESGLLIFTGFIFATMILLIPMVLQSPQLIMPLIKDEFTKSALEADGRWAGGEFLVSFIMFAGIFTALFFNYLKKINQAILILFISSMITINITIISFTPRIARYSQGAMLSFFNEKRDQDCYTDIIGFKSYIHLFYGGRKEEDVKNSVFLIWLENRHPEFNGDPVVYRKYFSEWLLYGNIDKPAYFVTNIRKEVTFNKLPQLKRLYEMNGYVFYKREAELKPY
jgi:hypothetical protein